MSDLLTDQELAAIAERAREFALRNNAQGTIGQLLDLIEALRADRDAAHERAEKLSARAVASILRYERAEADRDALLDAAESAWEDIAHGCSDIAAVTLESAVARIRTYKEDASHE